MSDYKEIRVDFDVTVKDTIDKRWERFPMMVNLWEMGWPDVPNTTVALVRAFIESNIGIDIPAPLDGYTLDQAKAKIKSEMWHHMVRLNLLSEIRIEADKAFGNDNFKRVIKEITIRQVGGPMPQDWRDENLWPKGLPEGERPWDKDPDFYEYPMSDWRPGK